MNTTQRKYALERIKEIYRKKQKKLKDQCDVSKPSMTQKDLVKQIKNGKITCKDPSESLYRYVDVQCVFGMPNGWLGESNLFSDDFTPRMKALDITYSKLRDKLMLGDALEALALIKEFEVSNL